MSFRRRLRSFRRLPATDRRLLAEAAAFLIVGWLAVRVAPFHRVAPRLGSHSRETPDDESAEAVGCAWKVRWAIDTAARGWPASFNCFPRAIAAKLMLRRRGVASTLYLGVRRDSNMVAHAWLRVGPLIVTGHRGWRSYTVVSSFA